MAHRDRWLGASWGWWTVGSLACGLLGCGGKAGDARCNPSVDVCDSSTAGGQGGSPTSSTTAGPATGSGGSVGAGGGGGAPVVDAGRTFHNRIVAYLPTWTGSLRNWAIDMPWLRVSQVNVAFARPAGSTLTLATAPAMPGTGPDLDIGGFVTTAHNAGAKVFVSLGGAGGSAEVAAQYVPANVDAFVANIVAYVVAQNLDGIDVDVEGNAVNATYGPFIDKLVQNLRPKGKQVTAALAQWFANNVPAATYAQFDSVNVMSYDHCGSVATPCATYDSAVSELNFFKTKGLTADKLILGVPFYCHCWGPGCGGLAQIPYAQVNLKFPGGMDDIVSSGTTYSCNGPTTIQRKAELARGYAGMMAWEISQDAGGDQSLLKVIDDHL
jgi:chitinase